jgi:hypothetical protein
MNLRLLHKSCIFYILRNATVYTDGMQNVTSYVKLVKHTCTDDL